MKKFLFLIFLLAVPAFARMGETREQCEVRYGKPISLREGEDVAVYQKRDFEVTAYFDASNRVERIEYRATNLAYEIEFLLKANAAENWQAIPSEYMFNHTFRAPQARFTAETKYESLAIFPDDWNERKLARDRRLAEEAKRRKLRDF